MKRFAARNIEEVACNIRALLLTQGLGQTLDSLCTWSVFSVD